MYRVVVHWSFHYAAISDMHKYFSLLFLLFISLGQYFLTVCLGGVLLAKVAIFFSKTSACLRMWMCACERACIRVCMCVCNGSLNISSLSILLISVQICYWLNIPSLLCYSTTYFNHIIKFWLYKCKECIRLKLCNQLLYIWNMILTWRQQYLKWTTNPRVFKQVP